MLFNVFHALWVQLFSISLAFLKKAKKKNCERAKKQIRNFVTNAERDLQFQTIKT